MDRLFTLEEVAEQLGCSRRTLARRIREGALPRVVDGRIVRVRESDLQRYLLAKLESHYIPSVARIGKAARHLMEYA